MSRQLVAAGVTLAIATGLLPGCSGGEKQTIQNTPVEVDIATARIADGKEAFSYTGTIEESETAPLSFSGVGTVSSVLVSEGDVVRKGQLLAELNSESFKEAYQMAAATVEQVED